jgi:hypothetical protein
VSVVWKLTLLMLLAGSALVTLAASGGSGFG